MSSSTAAPPSEPLERGKYARSSPGDLRGPCPMINCLANHGYLPRDGRNVRVSDFTSALNEVGLSAVLGALLSNPIFLEHKETEKDGLATESRSFFGQLWYLACNPWGIAFGEFGMRRPGQVDSTGERVLNLDQFSLHNVVEHDISLSRLDYDQGDNHSIEPDLVNGLLASSSDGKALTMEDLAALRGRRIEKQKEDNPNLIYESKQHDLACAEIALLLKVVGDGDQVHSDYARAFFREERLPIAEGWKKRATSIGLLELKQTTDKVKKLIGLVF
ncbi:Chloroperoxidase [Dactylonectria estremocensis]|uniref:Chloroperoxidase n=1 Tax=Dactylonectria estremocensis TaxID=1079267 RepID=A0A9P9IY14_9HYPO|nr:Chloroperoxidase [Dactylonectria estremocensis]